MVAGLVGGSWQPNGAQVVTRTGSAEEVVARSSLAEERSRPNQAGPFDLAPAPEEQDTDELAWYNLAWGYTQGRTAALAGEDTRSSHWQASWFQESRIDQGMGVGVLELKAFGIFFRNWQKQSVVWCSGPNALLWNSLSLGYRTSA